MCFEGIKLPRSTLKTTELYLQTLRLQICYSTEFAVSFGQAIMATKGSMLVWLANQKYTSDTENMQRRELWITEGAAWMLAGNAGWNSLTGQGIVECGCIPTQIDEENAGRWRPLSWLHLAGGPGVEGMSLNWMVGWIIVLNFKRFSRLEDLWGMWCLDSVSCRGIPVRDKQLTILWSERLTATFRFWVRPSHKVRPVGR